MGGLIIFLAIFAALAVVDLLAQRFGVDSRSGFEDGRAPVAGIYI